MNELNGKSSTCGHLAAVPDHGKAPRVVDLLRIARAVREILLDTPARVARAYRGLTTGFDENPGKHLATVFDEGGDELVLVKGIGSA